MYRFGRNLGGHILSCSGMSAMMWLPWQRPLPSNGALDIQQIWTSGDRTRESILMKFGIQQQIRTTVTVMWSNIKSWRTVVVGKYSKCHNSPANGPTGTQVLVVASHHVPNIGNAITPLTARPCPLLGHPAVHANSECTACSAITFSYCTAVQKQLLHGTPHSLTCTVWLSTTPEKHQTHKSDSFIIKVITPNCLW